MITSKQFIWILMILLLIWILSSFPKQWIESFVNSPFESPQTDGGALDIYYPSYAKMPSLAHPDFPPNPTGEQSFIYYPSNNLLKKKLPDFKIPVLEWSGNKPSLTNMQGAPKPNFTMFDFITSNVYTDSITRETPNPMISAREEGILAQINPENPKTNLQLGFRSDLQSGYTDVFLYDPKKDTLTYENIKVETIFHLNAPGKYYYRFYSVPKTYPQTLQKGTIPSYYLELTPNGTLQWALHKNDLGQLWTLKRNMIPTTFTVRFTGKGTPNDIYFINNVEQGADLTGYLTLRNFNVNMVINNTLYTINDNLNVVDKIYQKIQIVKTSDNSIANMRTLFGSSAEQTKTITFYSIPTDTTPFDGQIYNENYGKRVYLCTENLPGIQRKVVARSFDSYQDAIPSYVNRSWKWLENGPVEYFANQDENQATSANGWRSYYADMLSGYYFIPLVTMATIAQDQSNILKIDFTKTTQDVLSIGNRTFGRGLLTIPSKLLLRRKKGDQEYAYYSFRCLSRDLFIGYRVISFDTSNTDVNRLPITLDMEDEIFIKWVNPPPTTDLRNGVDVPKLKIIRSNKGTLQSLTSPDPSYFNYLAVQITEKMKQELQLNIKEFFANKPSLSAAAVLELTNLQSQNNTFAQENLRAPSNVRILPKQNRFYQPSDIWYSISQDQTKILYNNKQEMTGTWSELSNGTKKDDGKTMKILCLLQDRFPPNKWYAVGGDYKVYYRADLSKNTWKVIPNSGDIIYLSQMADGTFIGIGTNFKLYTRNDFVVDGWTLKNQKESLQYRLVEPIPNTKDFFLIGKVDNILYLKKNSLDASATSMSTQHKLQSITMPDKDTIYGLTTSVNSAKVNVVLKGDLTKLRTDKKARWNAFKNTGSTYMHQLLLAEPF